jgi:hypothetical protein
MITIIGRSFIGQIRKLKKLIVIYLAQLKIYIRHVFCLCLKLFRYRLIVSKTLRKEYKKNHQGPKGFLGDSGPIDPNCDDSADFITSNYIVVTDSEQTLNGLRSNIFDPTQDFFGNSHVQVYTKNGVYYLSTDLLNFFFAGGVPRRIIINYTLEDDGNFTIIFTDRVNREFISVGVTDITQITINSLTTETFTTSITTNDVVIVRAFV